MKVLSFILQKEFKQIFRDKTILAMMFVAPIFQLIILPLVANFDVKNINLVYINHDQSTYSHQLIQKITASGYFKLVKAPFSYKEGIALIEDGKADVVLEVPEGFERNLVREGKQTLGLSIDAINGSKSSLGGAYLLTVIRDFNTQLDVNVKAPQHIGNVAKISVESTHWYNPYMQYTRYTVPGILAILLTYYRGLSFSTQCSQRKGNRHYRADKCNAYQEVAVYIRKAHTLFGSRVNPLHLGAYGDVCSLWYLPRRKSTHLVCLCHNVPHSDSRLRTARLHLCRFTVAGYVHRLFLYNDIPTDEWFPHQCRQYARLESTGE